MSYITSIARPNRGFWLPGGQPVIDWTNPITDRLAGCWVATGELGNRVIRDLVTNTFLTVSGSGATIVAGPIGMGALDAGTGDWTGTTAMGQTPGSAQSVLWFGSLNGAFSGTPYLIGSYTTTTINAWGFFRNGADLSLITNATGSNQIQTATSFFPSSTSGIYTAVGTLTQGGFGYIYRNGILISNAVWGGGSPTGGATISVGLNGNGQRPNAGMRVAAFWNRQLSHGEAAIIGTNPTDFLVFPGDVFRGVIVGATIATAKLFLPANLSLGSGGPFFSDRLGT